MPVVFIVTREGGGWMVSDESIGLREIGGSGMMLSLNTYSLAQRYGWSLRMFDRAHVSRLKGDMLTSTEFSFS